MFLFFLIDVVDGSGICNQIFERFLEFYSVGLELVSSCSTCDESKIWGCSNCLFKPHCYCHNEALLNIVDKLCHFVPIIDKPSEEPISIKKRKRKLSDNTNENSPKKEKKNQHHPIYHQRQLQKILRPRKINH